MKPNFKSLLMSVVAGTVLVSNASWAASTKVLNREIDVANLDRLELEISVAELDMEIVDGDSLILEIRLEAERSFFGLRAGNVDGVELTEIQDGSRLFLGLNERNVKQSWVLSVPQSLSLQIELGVGQVHIDGLANDLDLEVGVGEVRVDAIEERFAEIQLQTGVGDATISGMRSRTDNERDFISADAWYEGSGEHRIQIDLGVGEIQVRRD